MKWPGERFGGWVWQRIMGAWGLNVVCRGRAERFYDKVEPGCEWLTDRAFWLVERSARVATKQRANRCEEREREREREREGERERERERR